MPHTTFNVTAYDLFLANTCDLTPFPNPLSSKVERGQSATRKFTLVPSDSVPTSPNSFPESGGRWRQVWWRQLLWMFWLCKTHFDTIEDTWQLCKTAPKSKFLRATHFLSVTHLIEPISVELCLLGESARRGTQLPDKHCVFIWRRDDRADFRPLFSSKILWLNHCAELRLLYHKNELWSLQYHYSRSTVRKNYG